MTKILRLYARVLALLGPEARLGWTMAAANLALASAQFVEPLLFGRIVDKLANAHGGSRQMSWLDLIPLVAAWIGFALFTIVCSTLVTLHSEQLAHRHTQRVRTDYFEHVLQLPLSFHTGTHSGRLMKIMLTATTTLWGLWQSFFREHLTSFVSLVVLMPLMALGDIVAALSPVVGSDRMAALVSCATWEGQCTVTAPLHRLEDAALEAGIEAPATLVVGDVVRIAGGAGAALVARSAAPAALSLPA